MRARHIVGAAAIVIVGVVVAGSASADDSTSRKTDAPGHKRESGPGSYVLPDGQNPSGRSLEDVIRENSAPIDDARLAELKRQAADSEAPVYDPTDPESLMLTPPPLTADDGK